MATNPNLEGDGTALFIANRLGESGVQITRLARGLASGGTLEFANRDMLSRRICWPTTILGCFSAMPSCPAADLWHNCCR